MSTLTALARAEAVASGRAQPIATVRHLHLHERPLVLVPLTLAGEANAPLAALVGAAVDEARLLVVPQPRNRDQRFAFAAALAEEVLSYVEDHRGRTEAVPVDRGRDERYRYVDAPQLLVPNPGGIDFVRLLGRATRFRRLDGDYPVPPSVPLLGRWLTFFADRAEQPGSSALLAMTDALTRHWTTGQSGLEDAHLGALLAWIAPPTGMSGAAAAAVAEEHTPPAGPVTDPRFDNEVLAPAIEAYQRASGSRRAGSEDRAAPTGTSGAAADEAAVRRAYQELASVLRDQLAPTWELMWRGVALLRDLPAAGRVPARWAEDRDAFTEHAAHIDGGGPPQPRRDSAVAAAQRLHRLERAAATYAAQRAYDDPLVMADHRLAGEAFAGEVVLADPTRVDDSGRRPVLRPRIMVRTTDLVLVGPGAVLYSPTRPAQKARVVLVTPGVTPGAGGAAPGAAGAAPGAGGAAPGAGGAASGAAGAAPGTDVVLELSGGMGRSLTPAPGSVPTVGERICYTTLTDGYAPPGLFPSPDQTPWTHGGVPDD